MRLHEIISTQITTSVSYDPAAKRLRFSGEQPRLRLRDLNRIKHIRRQQAKKDQRTSGIRQMMYGAEGTNHEVQSARVDQMALAHLRRNK